MRCRALFCGAVLCHAARCCHSNIQHQVSCEVPGTRCRYVRVLVLLLSSFNCPLSVICIFFSSQITPVNCRSQRGIAYKHAEQHRAISSEQVALGIIKSLVAPNHGPLLSAPFAFSCILPCASVEDGVSRPWSGTLVLCVRRFFCDLTLTLHIAGRQTRRSFLLTKPN